MKKDPSNYSFGFYFTKNPKIPNCFLGDKEPRCLSKFYVKFQFGHNYFEWFIGTTSLGKEFKEVESKMSQSLDNDTEGFDPKNTVSYLDYNRCNNPAVIPLGYSKDWILDIEGKVRVSNLPTEHVAVGEHKVNL